MTICPYPRLLSTALLLTLAPLVRGQADVEARQRTAAAAAIVQWVDDYERDRLGPRGDLRRESGLQPRYYGTALAAGVMSTRDAGRLTHLDALQKLLFFAENHIDLAMGDAVLCVAGAGLEKSLADVDATTVRDLGQATLRRIDHPGVSAEILRAARGTAGLEDDEGNPLPQVPVARRVAALQWLSSKTAPEYFAAIQASLLDVDPRVRLAAVEALQLRHLPGSLSDLQRCSASERHPVVAAALLRAILSVLRQNRDVLPRAEIDAAVVAALRQIGQAGWRADMDLVELVSEFPQKSAIPYLIDLLRTRSTGDDPLVSAVNKNASPLLRDRAWTCLKGMTGAIYSAEQYREWRQFWLAEQDRIQVPERISLVQDPNGTRSAFFGIPVTGRQIVFLIDTSGSMDEPYGITTSAPGKTAQPVTRLSAAKEQLLLAVQSMDPEARYQLLTFDSEARVYSKQPIQPNAASLRSLTELLSHLKSHGGTNVYDGLAQALSLQQLKYGQETPSPIDEVFLLSDGEPTAGAVRDPEEILKLVRAANVYLKARIHCVFAGKGEGAEFLRKLAAENGGVFVQR